MVTTKQKPKNKFIWGFLYATTALTATIFFHPSLFMPCFCLVLGYFMRTIFVKCKVWKYLFQWNFYCSWAHTMSSMQWYRSNKCDKESIMTLNSTFHWFSIEIPLNRKKIEKVTAKHIIFAYKVNCSFLNRILIFSFSSNKGALNFWIEKKKSKVEKFELKNVCTKEFFFFSKFMKYETSRPDVGKWNKRTVALYRVSKRNFFDLN